MACLSSCRATGRAAPLRAPPTHPTVAPRCWAVPGATAWGSCCRTQPLTRHSLLGSAELVMKRQCYSGDFGYLAAEPHDQLPATGTPPAIRAMVDDSRSAGAQQVARDISQLLATAVPNLHVDSGAYLWLSCVMWKQERITVHLLQRDKPDDNNTTFTMAIRADGEPADIVALGTLFGLNQETKELWRES